MFSNKDLKKLIAPIFLDQVLIIGVGIIATMMLSYAGEAAVSGVSLVEMINVLIVTMLAALTTGGTVVVSQYIGNNNRDKASSAAGQLVLISSIISVGIAILVLVFHKFILHITFGNISSDVMNAAITYFVISGLSYPFLAIYDCGAALFRSMANSKIPMIVSMIMNLLNLIGSAIGIFILHKGVAAVAISTVISRIIAAVIMIYLLSNKNNKVFISLPTIFSWNKEMIKRILNIGIPNGIENGIFQLGRILIISIITTFGTNQIAANGISSSLSLISITFASAINLAIVTVVGQCIGAGSYLQATHYMKKLIKIAYIGTIISSLGEILFLNWLLNLYSLPADVRHLVYILTVIHNCFAIILWPASFTLPNALRAAGDARFTMGLSITSMIVCRILFAYILGITFNLGAIGVWLAMGLDWLCRSIAFTIRYKSDKWKNFQVI